MTATEKGYRGGFGGGESSGESGPSVGSSTPWGRAQTAEQLAPGLVSVTTAGHGGIWVAPDRRAALGSRKAWYEEDCEWAKVAKVYPDDFEARVAQYVGPTLEHYYPNWAPPEVTI